MKKIIGLIITTALLISAVWYISNSNGPTAEPQISIVATEIITLQQDLAALARTIEDATLSPDDAITAQTKLLTSLDTIDTAADAIDDLPIVEEERQALIATAETLKTVFRLYQGVAVIVDTTVADATPREIIEQGGLTNVFLQTTKSYQSLVADSVREFSPTPVVVLPATEAQIEFAEATREAARAE